MALKQARRTVKIQTSLGDEAIQCIGMAGEEELSRMFRFQLDLVSMNPSIAAEDIVGKSLTFSIDYFEGGSRYFNGFVKRFSASDEDGRGRRRYRAEVVPWTWFLTQTSDCRIFQNKNVTDIISQIFRDLGFNDFETGKIKGNHPVREYCVQYRETDFAFVSRLMEEEGIFYFFRHENGKHTLVMADSRDAYEPCLEAEVECPVDTQDTHSHKPHIHTWEHVFEFRTGGAAHTDYNFKTPKTRLMASEKTLMKFQNVKSFEQYDYPGIYGEKPVGADLARIRMEELELDHNVVSGTSGCRSFSPGHTFRVNKHRIKSEGGKSWAIRRISHQARELSAYSTSSGAGDEDGFEYLNQFECFPDTTTFRPARITPRPLMRGCQTAEVTGPKGEEIYPDEHGRVKVQFHWDREGKYDENSSCWMRVSQPHAGKKWGYIDIPRIGEEVVVDFLEGDPDRPLIIGRVYNGQNPVPFDLPAEKTRRGNKTKTYKGDGYNELSMDDTAGKEQIRIHAQYNMDTVVEHDETHDVGHNRTKTIGNDEQTVVSHDRTEQVGHNESVQIGVDRTHIIGANDKLTVGGVLTIAVGGNLALDVGGKQTISVGDEQKVAVSADQSMAIGGKEGHSVGKGRSTSIGDNDSLSVGKQLMIEAGNEIILKTGSASITLKKNGDILIKGKNIKLEASGKIDGKASSDIKFKASKILQN